MTKVPLTASRGDRTALHVRQSRSAASVFFSPLSLRERVCSPHVLIVGALMCKALSISLTTHFSLSALPLPCPASLRADLQCSLDLLDSDHLPSLRVFLSLQYPYSIAISLYAMAFNQLLFVLAVGQAPSTLETQGANMCFSRFRLPCMRGSRRVSLISRCSFKRFVHVLRV